jgi:alpha-D-ribose 1-methylphosphonate 5-triphosphate diphosphatase
MVTSAADLAKATRRTSGSIKRTPSHSSFSLVDVRAVMPDGVHETSVVVRDGVIHRIHAAHATTRRIDCDGDYLLPGLIELHTDNLERHLEPRPGTFWSSDRAILSHDAELASAGITTAFDAITLGGDTGEPARQGAALSAIEALLAAQSRGLLRAQHYLHLRCELGSAGLPEQVMSASALSAPRLISLMEHVPGRGQWIDVEQFRFHYARRYGLGPRALDALIARRTNEQAENSAANRSFVVKQAHGHRSVLASHDDACVSDVELAVQSGCTICEFPTSLEAARAARQRGMHVVAGAPNLVRGKSHSGNVAASALAEEGLITVLSSDYYPFSLLQAVFELVRLGILPLHLAAATAGRNPALALGLQDRGVIEEGRRADLIRVRDTSLGPVVINAWCAGRQVA